MTLFSAAFLLAQAGADFEDFEAFENGAPPSAAGAFAALFCTLIVLLAIYLLIGFGLWKLFEKAGKPGWAGLIPIYNVIVLLEIIDKPIWWIILLFIPFVGIVIFIIMSIEFAKRFGKDVVYGVLMGLLPFIFYPLLGFSDAQYR